MLCYLFIGLVHKYPHFFEKKKKFFRFQTICPSCFNRCPRRNISHILWNETYVDVEMSINQSKRLPLFSEKNVSAIFKNASLQHLLAQPPWIEFMLNVFIQRSAFRPVQYSSFSLVIFKWQQRSKIRFTFFHDTRQLQVNKNSDA